MLPDMGTLKSLPFTLFFLALISNVFAQGALQFNEVGAYLLGTPQSPFGLSEFTVECWLMRTGEGESINSGTGGVEAIPVLSKGIENNPNGSGLNYFLGIRKEDGILVFDFESSLTEPLPFQNHPVAGFHPLKSNSWYHAAVTYDGSILKLYLNGELETAREINILPVADEASPLVIGGIASLSGQLNGKFVGKIDELRIWNYSRTQKEILAGINREFSTIDNGLITRIGFDEGMGNQISGIGAIPRLDQAGTGWEWTEGSPFHALIPPSCEDTALLKIGLISDPQYCDCDPSWTRFYRETLKKLPVAIDSLNLFQTDFVMNLGDMVDRYFESYDTMNQIYRNLAMPYYNLLGNHEFEEIPDSLKPLVLSRYGMPDFYYGFNYQNWRFLVLDGTELAAYSRSLHPELAREGDSLFQQVQDKVNNRPWNGGIGKKQRNWIRDQIQSAVDMKQNVILFCHFPVYPDTVYLNLWNNEEIIALIEEYPNVVAYINGHFHPGNYGFKKGVHYINQAAMLDTYDSNTFSLLEVHSDKLIFKGFGFNPDMILSYNDFFKAPILIYLTESVIHSDHRAGGYIGTFYSTSGSELSYSFSAASGEFKNSYFYIVHDSLFLENGTDISAYEEIPIQVLGINCSFDTVSAVFRLKCDHVLQDLSREEDEVFFRLYPNPMSRTFHIDFDKQFVKKPITLVMTDMNGRILKKIDQNAIDPATGNIEMTIDSSIPPGTYLIKLSWPPQNEIVRKFIVQN
jgi:manganese-dependent ADP-ribose/CDP-alcohol diphosphatase